MAEPPPAGGRRLFFALWPSADVQAALAERAEVVRRLAGGRRMRAETLHLTLAFLGTLEPEVARAAEAAAATVALDPFDLVLDTSGFFPRKGIGWLGPSAAPGGLTSLATDLRGALVRADVAFDPKPFVAHVTVLRNIERRADPVATPPLVWRVEQFALVESLAGDGRHEYRVVGRWPGR